MKEKRNNILEEVSRLYIRYGIKSVTMDDVSRELGISKKTLYKFFSDKNDLVKNVISYQIKKQTAKSFETKKQKLNAVDVLIIASRHIIKFMETFNPSIRHDLQKYYPDVLKILTEHRRKHIFENIKTNIVQGIKEGLYRKDLKPDIIAVLYVSRMDVIFNYEYFPSDKFDFSTIFNEMFKYHICGIANKKGIEHYEKKIKTFD
ncbi:MAG: TetR/AcrR family transcriptional regulator [Bacteroidales bacterium]|nr:TetR/AcrR family transcriptional regulator [Bacteroidales bacterium]